MDHYIGMDAHSKTCMFVVLDPQGNEVTAQRINTSEKEILRFVRSIPGTRKLTFEECHMSRWLYPMLKSEVKDLIVCNPTFIVRRSGPKNDYADTLHLAQQLRGGFLSPVFHKDHFYTDLRAMVGAYEDVNRELTKNKNRYKALFRSQALNNLEGTKIYSDSARIAELIKDSDKFVAEKDDYIKEFKTYAKKYPEIQALTSIPGISTVRANIIAAIVCSPQRFANKHKFWSYCMLVRQDKQSDGRSYGKVTKHANHHLKNVFMGAAETVMAGDSNLRKYYDQLRSDGVDHKAAKKNVARKIASIALALMRTKQVYKEEQRKVVETL
jgi:transposase